MRPIGVLTGLAVEASLATSSKIEPRPLVGCAGADVTRAAIVADELIAGGAAALLSFGLAGALSPGLKPGDLIVAETVVLATGEAIATDPAWRETVVAVANACGLSVRVAAIVGSDTIVATASVKARLCDATGAVAVDMESHVAAVAARRAGLTVLAVRAIADPATHDVPGAALNAIGQDGRPQLGRVLAGAMSAPGELPALWRLSVHARAGLRSLRSLVGGSGGSFLALS